MKAIGYYNPFQSPISFTGTKGHMVEVSPNTPVTNGEGFLIEESKILDDQVANGLLKRIYDTHPTFKDHNKRVEKQKKVRRIGSGEASGMSIEELKKVAPGTGEKARLPAPPEMVLSSKTGITTINERSPLPEGAVLNENGSVSYQNKRFASSTALKAYIASTGGSPNPLSRPIPA